MDAATRRMVRTKSDEAAVDEGMIFVQALADRPRQFMRKFLRHSKGEFAGKPFDLLDWQQDNLIAPAYGWIRPDGTRRFRRVYGEVPKKNGKSTLGSGISLYHLVADSEAGPEVYSAAADRDQASIVFNEAANMVEASPALRDRLQVLRSHKVIRFPERNGIYKALSADVPTKEGLNISALMFDELHAQKTRELWDTLKYGGAARRQPLYWAITTAGFDRESICWEQHCYALGVLAGTVVDTSFLACVYAMPEGSDWRDPEAQAKANPSWGVTINPVEMAEATREATLSPMAENTFKRYRLDVWTEQSVRFLNMESWDECDSNPPAWESLAGSRCYAGLDLASTTDLAAFAAWFPDEKKALFLFWAPEDADKTRERLGKRKLRDWMDQGLVLATSGSVMDYDKIRADILAFGEVYEIAEIAIDRWNSTQLQTQLMGDGVNVVQFGQGFASMAAPTKELEKLVVAREVGHGGNPVARWMASNLAAETDAAGNYKPSKKKSGDKIDGMVALIMAIGRSLVDEDGGGSVYDDNGLAAI